MSAEETFAICIYGSITELIIYTNESNIILTSRICSGAYLGVLKIRFSVFFGRLSLVFTKYFLDFRHQNIKRGGSSTLSSPLLDTPLY